MSPPELLTILASYHTIRGTSSLPSLVLVDGTSYGLSLAFPFVFHVMVPTIGFSFWIFLLLLTTL
jgi:hypothetical protein